MLYYPVKENPSVQTEKPNRSSRIKLNQYPGKDYVGNTATKPAKDKRPRHGKEKEWEMEVLCTDTGHGREVMRLDVMDTNFGEKGGAGMVFGDIVGYALLKTTGGRFIVERTKRHHASPRACFAALPFTTHL